MTKAHESLKRSVDLLGALIALAVLVAPILLVALVVKLFSRGPVFFRQDRVGRGGALFSVVKFRTMRVRDEVDSPVTVRNDERVTGIGRMLRRFKLDEMPQVWNVLVGNMSFVGPRPDVPGYADRLQGEQRAILELRPGITGPATLFFRNEEELLERTTDPQRYNDEVIWPVKVRRADAAGGADLRAWAHGQTGRWAVTGKTGNLRLGMARAAVGTEVE